MGSIGRRWAVRLRLRRSVSAPAPWESLVATAIVALTTLVPVAVVAVDATASEGAPVEIVGKRTASSKTFRNPGGTLTTRVFAGPVHFRGASGAWQAIESTFVASGRQGYAFRNKANGFRADFKAQLGGDHLRFEVGERAFAMGLEGAERRSGRVAGRALRYASAAKGVDVEYELLATGAEPNAMSLDLLEKMSHAAVIRCASSEWLEASQFAP